MRDDPLESPSELEADAAIEQFWVVGSRKARFSNLPGYLPQSTLELVQPPAWSFGRTPEQADALLDLVLAGTKSATASACHEYEREGEALPEPGALGIILDGRNGPRALIATTEVRVVPFDQVDEEHAFHEGEGDRTLAYWRTVHEEFFSEGLPEGVEFSGALQVVLERFTVLYQR